MKRILTVVLALVLICAALSGCGTTKDKEEPKTGAKNGTMALTIVEKDPTLPAFEYQDSDPYCFYAEDADGQMYRVMWGDFTGLKEQDRVIVAYEGLTEFAYTHGDCLILAFHEMIAKMVTVTESADQTPDRTMALTIVETQPSAPAFEYQDGDPYCFYAEDAGENLYRVLWSDFTGLEEKDRVIVKYHELKKLTYTEYPDGGWTPPYEMTATDVTVDDGVEGELVHHVRISSGGTSIYPFGRLIWSKTDNGDGTYEERIADHCDPINLFTDQADHIPTLTVKDDASYSTSANGKVEAVYLYSPVGDTYVSKATTWEALADLPGGTYYVMLAVLLGGNCDPYALQHSYRYEDFFRLVVDKPDRQDGVVYPTVQLHPLYGKYPEYFGLDGMKGVEIYVWQMSGNLYYCGALPGTNRLKTDEEILSLFDNGATLEEMRTILQLCEVDRERVSIIPVRNPLSSFWYEIDVEYAKQINALFWGE